MICPVGRPMARFALLLAPLPYTAAIMQASCPHSHMCSSCAASLACSRQ
jgi:hypothetical protein